MWNCTGKETEGGDYLELHMIEKTESVDYFVFICLLEVDGK
jgi:hypothetical protein